MIEIRVLIQNSLSNVGLFCPQIIKASSLTSEIIPI